MSITIKPNGNITVDTPNEAMAILKLMRISASSNKPTHKPHAHLSAREVLRQHGYEIAKTSTLKLVSFMLRNNKRAWTAPELSNRLHRPLKQLNNQLSKLTSKKILDRVGFAQYKAP